MTGGQTLPKAERLHHKKLIDSLFGGGKSRSMTAFPLRLVYMPLETANGQDEEPAAGKAPASQMLVSVPKRNLHRANKRNRVKRQVREAYRRHKDILDGHAFALAFIWLDPKLWPSADVEQRVVSLLSRVAEKSNMEKDTKEASHEDA